MPINKEEKEMTVQRRPRGITVRHIFPDVRALLSHRVRVFGAVLATASLLGLTLAPTGASGAGTTATSIVGFSPTSGAAGTLVTVTGTGFTGASTVSFNGTPAIFQIDNNSQLVATVPLVASSGTVTVGTPGGTATSSISFTVAGATCVGWTILRPRGCVNSADLAGGAVTTPQLADLSVAVGKIVDLAVTTQKLALGAVNTDQLHDLAVTAQKLAQGAVDTLQLHDLAVTTLKLALGAVNTDQLHDLAVTVGKLALGAVNTDQLHDLAVTAQKLAQGAVDNPQLHDLAVTTQKLALGAVGPDQLQAFAVTAQKLALGAVGPDQLQKFAVTAEKLADNSIGAGKLDPAFLASLVYQGQFSAFLAALRSPPPTPEPGGGLVDFAQINHVPVFARSGQACPAGQFQKGVDISGAPSCAPSPPAQAIIAKEAASPQAPPASTTLLAVTLPAGTYQVGASLTLHGSSCQAESHADPFTYPDGTTSNTVSLDRHMVFSADGLLPTVVLTYPAGGQIAVFCNWGSTWPLDGVLTALPVGP